MELRFGEAKVSLEGTVIHLHQYSPFSASLQNLSGQTEMEDEGIPSKPKKTTPILRTQKECTGLDVA
jgi:hypothetical protein